MKRNFRITFIIFSAFLLSACNKQKFDSSRWIPVENGLYGENYRKKMLDDLIYNVLDFRVTKDKKGTKKSDVIKLIGKPSSLDCNNYEVYQIEEKYDMIDPNGEINLKLRYDVDSTLIGYVIEDVNY